MVLIGLCGRKRSGKGSVATALESVLGFKRYAFADKLKHVEKQMFPWIPDNVIWGEDREREVFISHAGMINLGAPLVVTSRNLQQMLGQAIRRVLGENAWINSLADQVNLDDPPLAVIEDIRQPNELEMVKGSGGYIIRLNRADREGFHHFQGEDEDERCKFMFSPDPNTQVACARIREQHPTSWTSDQHETEWALPDESLLYDRIINANTGEEAAAHGISFVKQVLP